MCRRGLDQLLPPHPVLVSNLALPPLARLTERALLRAVHGAKSLGQAGRRICRMAQGLYGHKAGDFRKALDRAFDELSVHDHQEGVRPGQRKVESKPERTARPPDTKPAISNPDRHVEAMSLQGAPGSPERWRQVQELAPETYSAMEQEQKAQTLALLIDQWSQSDDADYYGPSVVQEVAKLVWDVGNIHVAQAARQAVEEIGGEEATAYLDSLMEHRLGVEQERQQQAHIESEGERMGKVAEELQAEYSTIERKLGPAALDAADQVAKEIDAQGLLYDAEMDPERARLLIRAAAEAGQAETAAVRKYLAAAEIGAEMKRIGSPGSNWNDAERANWEAELDSAHLEVFDRATAAAQPDAAAARALASRQRELTGNTAFMEALDAELAKLSGEDSAEHRDALRREAVAEHERTHDPGGEPVEDYESLERARRGGA